MRRVLLTVADLYDGFASGEAPRLTWRAEGFDPDGAEVRAELVAVRGDRTETATIDPGDRVLRAWPFPPVRPREQVVVHLRVDDGAGKTQSDPVPIVGGTLASWPAAFVSSGAEGPVLLRGAFTVTRPVRRATLYTSAFGAVRPRLNGRPVGDRELSPGWTSYQWRVDYDTYDVTEAISSGENVLGMELYGAWFTERWGFRDSAARFYAGAPSASVLLVLEHDAGADTVVVTDETWRWSTGAVSSSSLYQGEHVDARQQPSGWDAAGFDDSAWRGIVPVDVGVAPTPRISPPVRVTEEIAPVEVIPGRNGAVVLDFGQNLVGRLRLKVSAAAGTRLVLRHAEVLQDGELATRPLRNAAATDVYIADGAVHVWAPGGTFHGFRYAEISGWPGTVGPGDVVAEVLGTDLPRIGGFRTSHALLQRLHDNVVWGARGNFLSIPTDCPQRDERLGWTGDVQVFAPAAAFLFDCRSFLSSWLTDVRREQRAAGGIVPMVVPAVIPQVPGLFEPIAAWGDAITVVPWALRDVFADETMLRDNLDAMIAWVEAIRARTGGATLWEDGRQFGDWLDPDAPSGQPGKAAVDADIVATAYFFRSASLTARAAALAGRDDVAEEYAALAARIREAFGDTYITPSGRMMSDAPTAYALAIVFGLVDAERLPALGARLAELVRRRAYRISTGFVGTPIICDALTLTGHAGVAGRLLLQTENPSWLYPVTMGATTIWERWDSLREDGSLNPGQMTSFNHFALGAVADWLHRGLGGLTATAPGYARIRFAPVVLPGLDDAAVWHDAPHGRIDASWRREGNQVRAGLTVPPGVRAEIALPGVDVEVGAGVHEWVVPAPVPAPAAGRPSLDGPMTDVLASPEAYRIVMQGLAAWDPELAAGLRRTISWTPGRRLRDPLDKVPVAVLDEIQRRLDAL